MKESTKKNLIVCFSQSKWCIYKKFDLEIIIEIIHSKAPVCAFNFSNPKNWKFVIIHFTFKS